MSKNSGLLWVILVLCLGNSTFSYLLYQGQVNQRQMSQVESREVSQEVNVATAIEWGRKIASLYNLRRADSLYALFDSRAKAKLDPDQFNSQLSNLYKLFGELEDIRYVNSVKVGSKDGSHYHQLYFSAKVAERGGLATMKITLVVEGSSVNLFGLLINSRESLD
ncbi:MAG: hypothetical protein P8Q91_01240 [Porticoccaceae bacterium]|nr:hypothetical protein [Porticoccaceae bacterium]